MQTRYETNRRMLMKIRCANLWHFLAALLLGIAAKTANATNAVPEIASGRFQPTGESLKQYRCPDWFRDAKFGIYTHWGPVAVATARMPAGQSDCWYGRYMYCLGLSGLQRPDQIRGRETFEFHRRTFGDQSVFGFKDIIPMFKAEQFNADDWAALFAQSGAKFAGMVVIHHDNFAMWDSQVTRWNAVKMGPKRDLTGELEKAVRKRGLKFVAAMHHAMTWFFYEPAFAYDAKDPQFADLYGEPHPQADPDLSKDWCQVKWTPPSERFVRDWLAKTVELVDKYQPDLLWHDAAMDKIPESVRLAMAAHFYNRAAKHKQEGVLTYKFQDLPKGTAVLDFERNAAHEILPTPWLTDTSVGRDFWYYDSGDAGMFTTTELVRMLVDIVSKNGCLLLNVGPRPDGTISQKQRDTLLGIGEWLKQNGEAIYGTRPWTMFGEGPNLGGGGDSAAGTLKYSARDIRFTAKGDNALYAIALGWPEDSRLGICSLARSPGAKAHICDISLLGHAGKLSWKQNEDGLLIQLPAQHPWKYAIALKIAGDDLRKFKPQAAAATAREFKSAVR